MTSWISPKVPCRFDPTKVLPRSLFPSTLPVITTVSKYPTSLQETCYVTQVLKKPLEETADVTAWLIHLPKKMRRVDYLFKASAIHRNDQIIKWRVRADGRVCGRTVRWCAVLPGGWRLPLRLSVGLRLGRRPCCLPAGIQ